MDDKFTPKMTALDEQSSSLSDADYLSQAEIIKAEREKALDDVFTRLTNDALRIVDLGLCARPDA